MVQAIVTQENPEAKLAELAAIAEDVLARCRAAGATQAEVGVSLDAGLNVNVRMGEVETIERTRDRSIAVTAYCGKRKGTATSADTSPAALQATVDYAIAIAKHTEDDPCAGLAEPERLAKQPVELDLWHPWTIDADRLIEMGIACEAAGRALDARIVNSDGASMHTGQHLSIYANSNGFTGKDSGTRHTVSCALIAEDAQGMQRDYWYSTSRLPDGLEDVEAIGKKAAQRTVARLGAQPLTTRQCTVLFVPEVARGLLGHALSALSGGSLYRKASFLLDSQGQRIFPAWLNLYEDPHLKQGHGSSWFDNEGVATYPSFLVKDGVVQRYILSSYSARKLGLQSTGNAGGVHNIVASTGKPRLEELIKQMHEGLLVTEVMGQGVNSVTGDYSRGAAGFWVENGEIAFPVEGITIAGNLKTMYQGIQAIGADVDPRSHILTGAILIDRMMVAG